MPALWLAFFATPEQWARLRAPQNALLMSLFLVHYFNRGEPGPPLLACAWLELKWASAWSAVVSEPAWYLPQHLHTSRLSSLSVLDRFHLPSAPAWRQAHPFYRVAHGGGRPGRAGGVRVFACGRGARRRQGLDQARARRLHQQTCPPHSTSTPAFAILPWPLLQAAVFCIYNGYMQVCL